LVNHAPIGVFDSGVGGLTVLKALRAALPAENFLYLGDTARLPYGTKSPTTVNHYALSAANILVKQGIKLLVVACNTASSVSLDSLQQAFYPIPVVGVIVPGALAASRKVKHGPLVVLATESTVRWQAYSKVLSQCAPELSVIEWPCSFLVSLAEEGWCEGALVEAIIQQLLSPLLDPLFPKPQGILLGCTHFPVLKGAIEHVFGPLVTVIDPAPAVAKAVTEKLTELALLNLNLDFGQLQCWVTDGLERFTRVSQVFLGYPLQENVELVTLG
jgi:glutamate racemase